MAIGRLSIGKARLKRLEVDELKVSHLQIAEITKVDALTAEETSQAVLESASIRE